ncbi:hypothetical protein I0Q91_00920 [Halanaerobiaceae bacterium Z-7014]|uniref:Dimethlysulfonioproprionate lyase DddL n=1 Tax=Halonatronomonas betaini TaxID=2778430 RepID=A0A931F7M0_9FIRM|nr:dimethylsulfonioproprionate lyase family protein [Halonatronomonas betaini]MBF8435628.1 hypothetical protein [Halonatronomonas betaini]
MKNDWEALLVNYLRLYQNFNLNENHKYYEHLKTTIIEMENLLENLEIDPNSKKPMSKPVCRYLNSIIDRSLYVFPSLGYNIREIMQGLHWEHGYEELPQELADNYAYAEIASPEGPIKSQELILGMVLLGPNCNYPEHKHEKIEESYIVISGDIIHNGNAVFPPGGLIFNEEGKNHQLVTSDKGALLIYSWTAKKDVLENFEMSF